MRRGGSPMRNPVGLEADRGKAAVKSPGHALIIDARYIALGMTSRCKNCNWYFRDAGGRPMRVTKTSGALSVTRPGAYEIRSADIDLNFYRRLEEAPYGEWCRHPKRCIGLGACPRDPNCGE